MTYLRILFAAVIFVFLFKIAGAAELLAVFRQLEIRYIFYLIILAFVLIWISSLKWQLFVRESGHQVSVWQLMKWYTIGYFFNSFMPSFIGGDVVRSFHLGQHTSSHKDAYAATFLERFTGLLAMCFMGAFFVAIGSEVTKGVEIAVLCVAGGALTLGLICFSEHCSKWSFDTFRWLLRFWPHQRSLEKVRSLSLKVEDAMSFGRHNVPLFLKAMFWSFIFHILGVVNTYVAARAIGWHDVDISGLFVLVPLVLLVGMLPITPGGLGIQEGAFVFFLKRIGATDAQALGVGLVLRAKVLLMGIVGGVLWLGIRKGFRAELKNK